MRKYNLIHFDTRYRKKSKSKMCIIIIAIFLNYFWSLVACRILVAYQTYTGNGCYIIVNNSRNPEDGCTKQNSGRVIVSYIEESSSPLKIWVVEQTKMCRQEEIVTNSLSK